MAADRDDDVQERSPRNLREATKQIETARQQITALDEELAAAKVRIRELESEMFAATAGGFSTAISRRSNRTGSIRGIRQAGLRIDSNNRIASINDVAAVMIGKKVEELKGRDLRNADTFAFGSGFLRHTIEDVRAKGEAREIIQDGFRATSPSQSGVRSIPTGLAKWSILFTPIEKGMVDIVIEDVTQLITLQETLGRFVSPSVVEMLLEGEDADVRPAKRHISVLFCDLRGFTPFSALVEERDVSDLLDEFFSYATAAVTAEGGIVNKFLGDGLLALFGAPIQDREHGVHALYSAFAMLEQHQRLREKWSRWEFHIPDLGVGIVAGKAVVGVLGSSRHQDYTAIGRCVNLAKRVCDGAAGGEIHLPLSTYEYIKQAAEQSSTTRPFSFRGVELGERSFKGFSEPVMIVRVFPDQEPPDDPHTDGQSE
ncbi:MAG: adenylate/guanylate cyclase domain-containing protein [Planctomycetes bacterium]|nr:adenylate/guanylate cyclase domain-containing protein [Planctomycetota bacterium]